MKYKTFTKNVIIYTLLIIFFIGTINYIIDPLWNWDHNYKINKKQKGFNERQQKTNYIKSRGLDNFDGLIFGSSRTTFMNQYDFKDLNIFNYACSSMYPDEYFDYIEFAKEIKGGEFEYIFLGIDFFTSNSFKDVKNEKPNFYINKSKDIMYKIKMLFSLEALDMSRSNIKRSNDEFRPYYDRFNVHYQKKVDENIRLHRFNANFKRHINTFRESNYKYNKNLKYILKHIKEKNHNTKFIVFIPVITSKLMVSILKQNNRMDDYKRWLNELIDIFGEVHNFSTINTISKNLQNFPDDDHAYPEVQSMIVNKLLGMNLKNIPNDFGYRLNKDNINEFFSNFENQIKYYDLKLIE